MKFPNFIVIGAPKSGTTSLYIYLKQHPEIFLPVRKELHYFSYDLLRENANGPGDTHVFPSLCASREEYASHYTTVEHQTAIGEVSPSCLYYYQVSERIKAELGKVKIIALLRNPVDKAYSQYMHLIRENRETLSFYEALMAEEERKAAKWSDLWLYAGSSLYARGVEKYLMVFGHENVEIVLAEEFLADPRTTMQKIFQFLGVEPTFVPNTSGRFNRTGQPRSKFLANSLARPSRLKTILKAIIPERVRIPLRLALMDANTGGKDPMDSESRAYLQTYFSEDIKQLEKIIGRPTNWIRK